jgi:hypothetical protein
MSESVVISKGTDVVNVSISGQGEVNTGQNVGTGVGIFKEKVGADFRYRTLVAGDNITLTAGTDEVTIAGQSGYSNSDVDTHLNTSTAFPSQILAWSGTDYEWVADVGFFAIGLTDLSVTQAAASGSGTLTYNNTNGVFTYTPPDLTTAVVGQANNVVYTAVNKDTSTLVKGTPVYALNSGSSGQTVQVAAADASDPAKMPAIGVLGEQLTVDAEGELLLYGQIQGIDTQTPNFQPGDVIWVAEGGGFTNTKPSGEGNILQNLGVVTKRHTSNGGGLIEGSGRGAATPNLDDGKIFIGSGTDYSSTATLDTSIVPENGNVYYTDARVSSHLLTMDGSIIPDTDITHDLGSASKQWRDVYIGPGSLYVNGKKVIEDDSGTITVETDEDQNLRVKTTGTGVTQINSEQTIQLTATNSADIELTTATGQIELNGDVVIDVTSSLNTSSGAALTVACPINMGTNDLDVNNLVVDGNLTVSGTRTIVNTEEINLADNTILLNSNYEGDTPTENSGIEINRGDGLQPNKTFLWDETSDRWTLGTETLVAGTVIANLTGNVTGNVTGTVSDISNHTTDDLSEGSTNLYYTDARVDARANAAIDARVTKSFVENLNIDVDGGTY